jgi:antitoxin component YwqK of YwqJK toxin-antitoxin module
MNKIVLLLFISQFLPPSILGESNQSKSGKIDKTIFTKPAIYWSDFKYNSEEEKNFWKQIPDWSWIKELSKFRRDPLGKKINPDSINGHYGHARRIDRDWNLRIIYLVENGWVIKSQSWDQAGKVRTRRHYKEGKLEGLWTGWHRNGAKQIEFSWGNGYPIGRSISWHENGKISETGNYQSGKMHGEWITYQFDGTEKNRLTYNLGEIVSK